MFQQQKTQDEPSTSPPKDDAKIMGKYKNFISSVSKPDDIETNSSMIKIDQLLEKEKKHMSAEPWNKLDKRLKIQKLHAFAEKYGRENTFPMKEIKGLKTFFSECLAKDKLAKVKDVEYDRETGVINSIPSLFAHPTSRAFTLRNLDKKVSTLKSLTPKKNGTAKSNASQDDEDV
jgi:hypothetical protein